MTVKSIGSATRDYATPALWWADCPANLVTSTDTWEGECYNDSEFTTTATTTFSGVTASATYYPELRCASGEAFNDDADKLTNALRYNQSNGVGIRKTSNYGFIFDINQDYFRLKDIQLRGSGNFIDGIDCRATGLEIDNCIVQTRANLFASRLRTVSGTELVNSIFIDEGSVNTAEGVRFSYVSGTIANCTVISLAASNTKSGLELLGAISPVAKNTAVFGFSSAFDSGSWGAGSDYNASDDTTSPGANSQDNLTFSDQFENVAGISTLDLRAVSTGSLDENGTRDQTNTNDLDILGQSRSTTAPTIGAHEVVSGSSYLPTNFLYINSINGDQI
jgi:hypothetical protein